MITKNSPSTVNSLFKFGPLMLATMACFSGPTLAYDDIPPENNLALITGNGSSMHDALTHFWREPGIFNGTTYTDDGVRIFDDGEIHVAEFKIKPEEGRSYFVPLSFDSTYGPDRYPALPITYDRFDFVVEGNIHFEDEADGPQPSDGQAIISVGKAHLRFVMQDNATFSMNFAPEWRQANPTYAGILTGRELGGLTVENGNIYLYTDSTKADNANVPNWILVETDNADVGVHFVNTNRLTFWNKGDRESLIGIYAENAGIYSSSSKILEVGADQTNFMLFALALDSGNIQIKSEQANIVAATLFSSAEKDTQISFDASNAHLNGNAEASYGGQTSIGFEHGYWIGKACHNSYVLEDKLNTPVGIINVTLGTENINNQEATWYVTDSSTIDSLTLNNGGHLSFAAPEQGLDIFQSFNDGYHSVTTSKFQGNNGVLSLRIDMAQDSIGNLANDQLIITQHASGKQIANIIFEGDKLSSDKPYSENWLVYQADSDTNGLSFRNFDGTNKYSGNGMLTTYSLLFTKDENIDSDTKWEETGNGKGYWHLVQIGTTPGGSDESGQSTPAEAQQIQNLGSSVAQAVGWLSEKNDLRRRLGEVRYGSQAGAWAKAFTRQDRAEGFRYNGFKQESTGIHIGYDTFVSQNEHTAWLVGATFRYAHSKQEGIETAYGGDGKLNEYSGKVYATWMHESGSYMDILAQVGYYDQEINGLNNVGNGSFDADYHNWGYGASVEVGHMFTVSNGSDDRPWYNHWFIEPQLELSYFYVKGEDFKTSTGLKVEQGDADFLTGRAGLVVGKKVNYGTLNDLDKRWYQIGVIGGVTHEFLGDQTITFTGTEGKSAEVKGHGLGGTSFYYGVTADWQVSDNVRLYGEVSREEGEHYTKDYGVNVGFKYSF